MIYPKKLFLSVFALFAFVQVQAQSDMGHTTPAMGLLERYISDDSLLKSINVANTPELHQFYVRNEYEMVWTDKKKREQLKEELAKADKWGLDSADYRIVVNYPQYNYFGDSAEQVIADISYTQLALRFFGDLMYGKAMDYVDYNGLDYRPYCRKLVFLLSNYLNNNDLESFAENIELQTAEYQKMKKWMLSLKNRLMAPGFEEYALLSKKVSLSNHPLMIKLYQLNIIDSLLPVAMPDSILLKNVKTAQHLFGLKADGIVGKNTLAAFNVPLKLRLKEVKLALNHLRWLHCIKQQQQVAIVNIPSANLKVYDQEEIVFYSKVVVGKDENATPTLSSKINQVILYPYWNVPYSITTKELLPKIKNDPNYLAKNSFQVLKGNGTALNADSIDWNKYNTRNFPYFLRQGTGGGNSLGLIKLNFANPYSVYLHDTPAKTHFNSDRRYLSHGCVRVEGIKNLAQFLLKDNSAELDTLIQFGPQTNQKPIVQSPEENLPIFIVYSPAWFDKNGAVRFYEDIYGKFNPKPIVDELMETE